MVSAARDFRHAQPLEHPPGYGVTIGDTFYPIPKDLAANKKWRHSIVKRAEGDPAFQSHVRAMCSQPTVESFLFWLNIFAFTFKQQEVGEDGRQRGVAGMDVTIPFISWPTQDAMAAKLIDAILTGKDCAVDKSRQMGVTWLICSVFLWFTLHHRMMTFEVMSRVEELVDNPGDMRAIFQKVDFILKNLPGWLRPPGLERTRLKLVNPAMKSAMIGRSTTGEQGRGGACNAALIDEAAMIPELEAIWTSLSESTSCRIVNSTPKGAGYFSKLVRRPEIRKLRMPWWEHPEKGRGRYMATDPETGEVFTSSPFYEGKCLRASPDGNWFHGRKTREIAQELDMDHAGAGQGVFTVGALNRQESVYGREPYLIGRIGFREGLSKPLIVRRKMLEAMPFRPCKGNLRLWCDPTEGKQIDRTYTIGIDISQGVGASNSVASVFWVEAEEFVGELVDSNLSPAAFAVQCCALGYLFGGRRGSAFLVWEANGYGGAFGKWVKRLMYPWYYKNTADDVTAEKTPDRPRMGWYSNQQRKLDLFSEYDAALCNDSAKQPCLESIEEARSIVHYETGGIGPAELEVQTATARSTHADRVTANALAVFGALRVGRASPQKEQQAPRGSAAWRRQQRKKTVGSWS